MITKQLSNMDIFKGMELLEFTDKFNNDESCKAYLAHHKWSNGFICPKCGCKEHHHSKDIYVKRCKKCFNKDSVTSGTLFHKVKFPLRKAFMIVFQMSTTSKSISANQLSKSLGINPKTAWLFEQKIRIAMQSSQLFPLMGEIDVDEAFIGGKEEGHQGRGNQTKSTIVFAIEKTKNDDGIKRAYAMKIDNTSSAELSKIFHQHIDPKAHITTDKWTGYMPLVKEWDITQVKSKGGENFQLMHRLIQGVKSWIRAAAAAGIYHKVSPKYLQAYLDEYCYRFNRNIFKDSIFDNLIQRMIRTKPMPYKSFSEAISI